MASAFWPWRTVVLPEERPLGIGAHRYPLPSGREHWRRGAIDGGDPRDQSISANGNDDLRSPRSPKKSANGFAPSPGVTEALRDWASAATPAAARVGTF